MFLIVCSVLICVSFVNVQGINNFEGNIYHELPPIFKIDDYWNCKMEGKLFCKLSVILKPLGSNVSQQWKLIQHSIKNKEAYNHNELFHAICVNDFCKGFSTNTTDDIKDSVTDCYKQNVSGLGLTAEITNLNCTNVENTFMPTNVDYAWIWFFTVYVLFIFYATYWDYRNGDSLLYYRTMSQQILLSSSLIKNFQKLIKTNTNEDFQRLKCIQGIRFYNMLLIILFHTFTSYIGSYVMNTEYMENISNNPIRHGIRNFLVFLVQTFFLISAFLMSFHFFQIIENPENKDKKLKIVGLTFINRYLRIIPPVAVKVAFGSTVWVYIWLFSSPIKDIFADAEYFRCRKNWWATLFFISNHYNHNDMCNITLWYLAADTQLYLLSLLILMAVWKYRKMTKYILPSCVAIGIWIPAVLCYIYDHDIFFRFTPENGKIHNYLSSKFSATYTSTYTNMATYMVGLCCGCLYFYFRNVDIKITKTRKMIWYTIYFGLPLLVIVISSQHYSRLTNAVLTGILRPLYAIGIAVGVFGMSRGLGGMVKQICEWQPAVILGNLSFSTYAVHYIIVFHRTADTKQPFYISDYVLFTSFLRDAFFSFLLGLTSYLLVELPVANIQNLYVPQVRCQRVKDESAKEK